MKSFPSALVAAPVQASWYTEWNLGRVTAGGRTIQSGKMAKEVIAKRDRLDCPCVDHEALRAMEKKPRMAMYLQRIAFRLYDVANSPGAIVLSRPESSRLQNGKEAGVEGKEMTGREVVVRPLPSALWHSGALLRSALLRTVASSL